MLKTIGFGKSGNEILQKYAKMSGYSDIDKYCLNSNKDLKIIETIKNAKVLVVGGLGGSSTKLLYQALPKLKDNNCKVAVLATIPFEVEECNRLLTALSIMDFIEETTNESIIVPCDSFVDPKKTFYTLEDVFDCIDVEIAMMLNDIFKNIEI